MNKPSTLKIMISASISVGVLCCVLTHLKAQNVTEPSKRTNEVDAVNLRFSVMEQEEKLKRWYGNASKVSEPLENFQLKSNKLETELRGAEINWPSDSKIAEQSLNPTDYKNEITQTLSWWKQLLDENFLPNADEHVILLPQQTKGDDWVLTKFTKNGVSIQIIDGRNITLVINPVVANRFKTKSDSPIHKAELVMGEKDVVSYVKKVFRTVTKYYEKVDTPRGDIQAVNVKAFENGFTGELKIEGQCPFWFIKNFEWWSNGTVLVIKVDKILAPPFVKWGTPNGEEYVYGLPNEDTRPFKRFVKDNSIDFDFELKKYAIDVENWRVQHVPGYLGSSNRPTDPKKQVSNRKQVFGDDSGRTQAEKDERNAALKSLAESAMQGKN